MLTDTREEWVTMSEAARIMHVSFTKIHRLVAKGRLEQRRNPRDDRVRLVDLSKVRELFGEKDIPQ